MEVTATVMLMSADEARQCVSRIQEGMENVRALLLELYEREGWKVLGYDSWRHCIAVEFSISVSRAYQLLNAAQVDRTLSTYVEKDGPIPDLQARELARLSDEPEAVREVWAEVQEEHGDAVTAADVRTAVDRRLGVERPQPTRRALDPDFADDYVEDVNQDSEYEPTSAPNPEQKSTRSLTVGMPDEEREEYERRQRATVSFARSTSSLHALLQPAPERIAQDWLPAENGLARIAGCEQLWTGAGLRELAGWLAQTAEAWEAARS